MDNEVKESAYMASELIISAVFLGLMAFFIVCGYRLLWAKELTESSQDLLEEQAYLYPYLNSDVTGSDIVDISLNYAGEYTIVVAGKSGTSISKQMLRTNNASVNKITKNDGLVSYQSDWSIESLTNDMSNYLYNNYQMKEITTADGNSILALAFFDLEGDWSTSDMEYVAQNYCGYNKNEISFR